MTIARPEGLAPAQLVWGIGSDNRLYAHEMQTGKYFMLTEITSLDGGGVTPPVPPDVMTKAVYDTNSDGIVDHAALADTVAGGAAYIASVGQTQIIPSGYPNANPPDLIDTVSLNRHTGLEPGDVRVYQPQQGKLTSINWSSGLTLNAGAGSLLLNSDANQDLIVSAPDGPNSGKSFNLTNGFVAGTVMARYQSSFTTVRELYCSGWTPGTPAMTPVPDFAPPVSYKSFVKGCWFFLSQYGPAPAGCTVTIYVDQTNGTAIPLCTATDISGLTASQVIRPTILSTTLATLLIRNTGRGDQVNYGAGISAAPSNAGANPAVAWGIEFGIAAYYS